MDRSAMAQTSKLGHEHTLLGRYSGGQYNINYLEFFLKPSGVMLSARQSLHIQRGSHARESLRPSGEPDEAFLIPSSFITTNCALQFSSRGIRPGLTTVLARNLDKNTMGYLQWRWGIQSAMNTSIVRDTKTSHFTVALQVRVLLLCAGDSVSDFLFQQCFGLGIEGKGAVDTVS